MSTEFDVFQRSNIDYLETMYRQYQRDPDSVGENWKIYFAGFEAGAEFVYKVPPDRTADGLNHLVHSYRELGHLVAKLNPLGGDLKSHPLLELTEFGFNSPADMGKQVGNGGFLGQTDGTLRSLLEALKSTYCENIGVEFLDIPDKRQREWLLEKMEPSLNSPQLSTDQYERILELVLSAKEFEQFLHTKFIGQKRFSVEGGEALIALLDVLIDQGSELGAEQFVMGMAHRGRLNVLAHILEKPYTLIFREFEGTAHRADNEGDGDVKYHLGYSNDRKASNGNLVHCSLSFNPSHLELVNPVVEGMVRAKQQYLGDHAGQKVVPVLIHGEAAFTGQGIVFETLNLSELDGFRTGGTIHIIVNNQVGFTATARETRFTPYPTDVAKMIQAPIFHVNGDDPLAVAQAARLAIAFRQEFKVDVMIDLWCYRKHGHNETDDPTFTQPVMYKKIANLPSVAETFPAKLVSQGILSEDRVQEIRERVKEKLNTAYTQAKEGQCPSGPPAFEGRWKGLGRAGKDRRAQTAINREQIEEIMASITKPPETFNLHPKLKKLCENRAEMGKGNTAFDWGAGEALALGSLLKEGISIRLTGQDVGRGTFTHRHAVWHDFETGDTYTPLAHLNPENASFTILNTMLSELAVVGFEFGYSSADPRNLVIWEAQFGDFVNMAQPILDQFLSSSESKWQRMSGLVMLLPHGYEGQGPEHSSGRLERFLQLCAEENIQVCYPTMPANFFHLLRRQVKRNFRKPLIVMSPKSLLRHERAVSKWEDFTTGEFSPVLDDATENPGSIEKVLFCTGKVYFTLSGAKAAQKISNVAVVRVEELYPFAKEEIQNILSKYGQAKTFAWVQEEPKNMGAWTFIEPRLRELVPNKTVLYHGRKEASSPATGSYHRHEAEEKDFVRLALETASQSK